MSEPLVRLEDWEAAARWAEVDARSAEIAARFGDDGGIPAPTVPLHWHGEALAGAAVPSLVKGLLPAEGVALKAGQSGAGKTFLAIELAGALAVGAPFFGHPVKRSGGTLFLVAEAVATIGERIEAMTIGRGIEARQLPLAWREVSGLSDPARLADLLRDVKAVREDMQARHGVPLVLVIVDTIAAAFGFADENDAAEATRAMLALQRIGAAAGGLALGIAHHGKTSETGVRGSSAFTASADVILSCLAERDINGKVTSRTLALTKSRRAETGWNCPFELHSVELGEDEDGDPVDSCHVVPILDAAREGATPRPKGSGLTRSGRIYCDALQTALGDAAEKIHPFGDDGPAVWCVDRETVRREFYSRWPADGATDKAKEEARRKQFNRGEQAALASHAVHLREIGGAQLVWKA